MPAAYPSAHNTFVPSHEATGKLVVDFARNIKDFAVNRYTQVVPVKQPLGYYLKMTVEEAGRIVHSDGSNFLWADGQPAPEHNDGAESFEYLPFRTLRRSFGVLMGDQTVENASWDILAQHASIKARQAMTFRTQAALAEITTAGNYDASHVLDVTAIVGNTGNWEQSTTARQDIKRSLTTAAEVILDDTLTAVKMDDMILVINSALAAKLTQSQEIVDYIKGSPDATAMVRGELPNGNVRYGLPDKLYGFPIVVEDTRKVTSRKGATRVTTQILATSTPFLCARPGSLEAPAGGPNFSTCVCFAKEEMTVEKKRDDDNRRVKARVVEDYVYEMTAPATGILFTSAA